ncbi:MAG: hypothetical protein AWM53_00590 [Candidatus Dichloromethanomonas elyunquensis]|nr:MAG: hypothetical protein AWM53_00590 [Candidatus Dichloromethanomonas elyunquensis]
MELIRVLLADDNRDFVEILREYINSQEDMALYNDPNKLNTKFKN